jgi:hypothetical protein
VVPSPALPRRELASPRVGSGNTPGTQGRIGGTCPLNSVGSNREQDPAHEPPTSCRARCGLRCPRSGRVATRPGTHGRTVGSSRSC